MASPCVKKKLVIPSDVCEAVGVVHVIVKEAESFGYGDGARFAIQLALDEALANAIRHGNRNDPSKKITIEYALDREVFDVTICDQGKGFDPGRLPDPTLDENLERPCGRGVMLIRAYMTHASYNHSGNCLHMIKRRDCPLPAKSER
jgi:serine/threonine-protein kinase RsbW